MSFRTQDKFEMMKIAIKVSLWLMGALLTIALVFGIVQTVASERVEVIELATLDIEGARVVTRLWVVDDEGFQYLRVGQEGSGWFSRISNSSDIEVTRADQSVRYTTVLREDKSEKINQLMQSKYTWGDTFFAVAFGGREGSIPIELHAVD